VNDKGTVPAPSLKRELGIAEVTLAGIGIILGAGIYALLGTAAGMAGNAVWLSFIVSAIVALFTCLSYAELSSMFPDASAEYEYTLHAFGKQTAFVIGWLIIFSGIVGASTVAIGFGGYLGALIPISEIAGAIGIIIVLSLILVYGVRESTLIASVFTLVEAGGLVLIIIAGIPWLGRADYFLMPAGAGGVLSAAALVFFAYMGFEEMVKFSEETSDPTRVIPKALILAITLSIILYVLVAVSCVSVVGWEALSSSPAPFVTVAAAAWGTDASVAFLVIALFATSNTVLLMLLAASRISFGMSRSNALPGPLAYIHPRLRTPVIAIVVVMALSILFTFFKNIGFVANITNFLLFVTFIVINATLILLRYRMPGYNPRFRVPFNPAGVPVLPVLGILTCLFLILQLEADVVAAGGGILVAGIFIVFFTEKMRRKGG
jgi:APA family basic amino acid/polyamine antiporter